MAGLKRLPFWAKMDALLLKRQISEASAIAVAVIGKQRRRRRGPYKKEEKFLARTFVPPLLLTVREK